MRLHVSEITIQDFRVHLAYAREFPGASDAWYWASLWPAAVALAEALYERDDLAGARVLEIGCGCGLAGIAAGRKGGEVTVTDLEPRALALAEENWRRNHLQPAALKRLDWRDSTDLGTFDVILGADILYDEREFPSLIRTLRQKLSRKGRVLIAEPGRPQANDFFARMLRAGFGIDTRHHQVDLHGVCFEVSVSELA
ncbi:MAG: methyltransferase domain-containing protein [Verrucomicrobia bacterium]|nr:methyltransferase domain-containing protein [Verrucomicrobiota bacterium]MCH8512202.1 protein N-lysine methyltransferase family protein [Kiritimatiellia bacterium]